MTEPHEDGRGRLFWPAVAIGWAAIIAGTVGLLVDAPMTRPGEAVRWVVGGALLHDLVLAPAVVLIGWGLARAVPAVARGPVQAAAVVSGVVALFAWPFVRGYGRVAPNPSILPRNYAFGLAVVLVAVWVTAGAACLRRRTATGRSLGQGGALAERPPSGRRRRAKGGTTTPGTG